MPHEKMRPASAKSSSAGLGHDGKRKQSRGRAESAKSSPAREMAPFFSIFYRGISTKMKRSQSKAEGLEKEQQLGETTTTRGKIVAEGGAGMERSQSSRKFVDKPPLPLKSKNNVGDTIALHRKSTAATAAAPTSRSRSTVDLAKEKAAAEGKMWREEPSSPELHRKAISSAPNSPQSTRRWPFGSFSKAQPKPKETSPVQNGFHEENGGQQAHKNGFLQDDQHVQQQQKPDRKGQQQQKASLPPAPPPPTVNRLQQFLLHQKPPTAPPSPREEGRLSFAQRIKLHKGVRTGKLPVEALRHVGGQQQQQHLLFAGTGGGGAKFDRFIGGKRGAHAKKPISGAGLYMSADAIHELSNDPDYIAEALRTLGDEQPKVARSTPKHAYISQDPKRIHDRLRRDCLYPQDVYEKMVKDSLLVCDLLQSHLDEVISGVRAKSPTALSSPFTTPPGSPFMARSTSMQMPGSSVPINRVTISVSPMAQQANPTHTPRASGASLPPAPFPTSMSPPLVRVTPASFRGEQFGSPRAEKRLQFVS